MSGSKSPIVLGSGAGYSGDRIEPAEDLVASGRLNYIAFECLAERTIALAQLRKMQDPETGFDPLLAERMERILPLCHRHGVRMITNMGAANPSAALKKTAAIAEGLGLRGMRIAAVLGDDVGDLLRELNPPLAEDGRRLMEVHPDFVSANAYLGVEGILSALQEEAHVVITGRVADPSLFLAPLIYEFGWELDDWDRLGSGTLIGHLLECAGQLTGGYYAEPGRKEVPDLPRLGFPLAEVFPDGKGVLTKLPSSGGKVDKSTCAEQLLYEIHDPSAYVTPDVVADFSRVCLEQTGPDRVRVSGAGGRKKPEDLKVVIGYHGGYVGEGFMGYAGPGALARARLAAATVRARLEMMGVRTTEIRFDLLGVNALSRDLGRRDGREPGEVVLRVAAKAPTLKDARRVADEVEALYTNGPAGGGGAIKNTREIIAVATTFIPRDAVSWELLMREVK